MSIVFKAGSGLLAGAVAGALGLAFLPRVEPSAVNPRNAVEKPSFVVAAPSAAPTPRALAAVALALETPAAQPPVLPTSVKSALVAAVPTPATAVKTGSVAAPAAVALRGGSDAPAPTEASTRWSVRGLVALARGDLSSARLFLTRAAETGDPRAFVALADTYDPAVMAKLGVTFAPSDSARAKDYLMKAVAAGVVVPKDRLAALDPTHSEVR